MTVVIRDGNDSPPQARRRTATITAALARKLIDTQFPQWLLQGQVVELKP
ncbi:hypothetical protein OIE67_48040 [Nonomuraea fuscirosea]|nr:hypothetical protein [Nonomuraea fuscirosea]WSA51713.1 hypothetical protein OIE67_48040 [Nonomuraea fuscirosea]